jgi:hypothetical protein
MTDSNNLCEVCHERAATCHVCEPHLESSRDLCQVCFDAALNPAMAAEYRDFLEKLKKGKCRFCGGPAVGGSGGAMPFADEQYEFFCEECRRDMVEYESLENKEPSTRMSAADLTEAGVRKRFARLTEREAKLIRYINDKISQRSKKG